MAKKLFVGNLPFSVTEQDLVDAFSQAGAVETVNVITDRATGRSKGFAFVEMASDQDAQSAIEKLNGAELNGRAMNVNEARPMEPRAPRPGGFGGGAGRPPRDGGSRGGFGGGGGGGGNRRDFGGGGGRGRY